MAGKRKVKGNRESKYGKYTQEQFDAVLEALKRHSLRQVSRDFNIPRATIFDWQQNPNLQLGAGKTTVLSPAEEDLIVKALLYTASCGFPQTREHLKDMVQSYVLESKKKTPFKNGRPGKDWVLSFERRNKDELRRRKREGLCTARAKGLTKDNVTKFYDMYEQVLKDHNLSDKPWVIFNIDETGLTAHKNDHKVYVGAGVKNAYSIHPPGTKTMYTVLFCCSAIGHYLPPYTIYRSKTLWDTWTKGGVKDACYGFSESGWMIDVNFETWFSQIFVPYTKEIASCHTRVLLYDGHNSHITYKTVKTAMDNDIVIVCLPPNTSHALQPLDVAVFRSVKVKWANICQAWFRSTWDKSVDKATFPALLKDLWEQLEAQHAVKGFNKCGLYPFNRNAVDNKILNTTRDQPSQPAGGPRSSERLLIKAISQVLKPTETPEILATLANRSRKRTRVQCEHGEVLTDPNVETRLLAEQEVRENKKKKKQPATSKAGKSVSITMKPVPQSTANKSTAKPTGNLDHFGFTVTKVQKKKVSEKKNDSVYKDISTEDSSDADDPDSMPDDPPPQLFNKSLIKKLKPGASHVIINYEGAFFPGLVTSLKKSEIVVKTMVKSGRTTWSWPAIDDLHDCEVTDIVELISPPKLSNNRGTGYFVPRIANYWKF